MAEIVEHFDCVSDSELSSLYEKAYALLMPSLYEGFGLPVVEAMEYNVPALVSQNSSLTEVAGSSCLSIDPLSEESIFNGITHLAENKIYRDRLSNNCSIEVKKYSWDTSADKILSLINAIK